VLTDDAFFRKLLSARFELAEKPDTLTDHSAAERHFKDRQLLALAGHCMPGFGSPFDVRAIQEQNGYQSVLVACSPRSGRPITIRLDRKGSERQRRQHRKTIEEVIDALLVARAAALGRGFDPRELVELAASLPRGGVPQPVPGALLKSIEEVRGAEPAIVYSLDDFARLVGIVGHPIADMMKSTLYVSRKDSTEPHQLPRRSGARQSGGKGRFESGARWPRDEVLAALKGWAKRCGLELTGPF